MSLRVYVGQTRDPALLQRLADLDIGECTQRGQLPPRRSPWFYDNGAFADWRGGREFNRFVYWRDMKLLRACIGRRAVLGTWWARGVRNPATGVVEPALFPAPDFIVLPDLVGRGVDSLRFSESFLGDDDNAPMGGHPVGVPLYLAVQDGLEDATGIAMVFETVLRLRLGGIFVGGTLKWKIATAAQWVRCAHRLGRPVHIGRVGTEPRLRWAERIGADSVDSSLPLWSRANLARFVRGLAPEKQLELATASVNRQERLV